MAADYYRYMAEVQVGKSDGGERKVGVWCRDGTAAPHLGLTTTCVATAVRGERRGCVQGGTRDGTRRRQLCGY